MVSTASDTLISNEVCVIVGASHAGVNCAFELRKQGFDKRIVLIDADEHLPYHRPPLSKAFLNTSLEDAPAPLKAQSAYEKANVELLLGVKVTAVNSEANSLTIVHSSVTKTETLEYTYLVLATGASPIVPPIPGITKAKNCLVMRNANDALALKSMLKKYRDTVADFHVVVIGAGFIGLEAAASLRKAGANVTVLERESRILARVASETISDHVARIHRQHRTNIVCKRNVQAVEYDSDDGVQWVVCDNGERYRADAILMGVGVRVNSELATQAGINLYNGAVCINAHMQTSSEAIWAIGDCTSFPHPEYGDNTHIESVQNALEQAKVAAKNIQQVSVARAHSRVAIMATYEATPWFWSDQYDMKLQMVGLISKANNHVVREESETALSIWHFTDTRLVGVEAINSPKSYVLGAKALSNNALLDKTKLSDPSQNIADFL